MQLLLFIAFIVMPIVEITVLVQVGQEIGALATIGLVILTALIGSTLVKRQGFQTLANAQLKMAQGQLPGKELLQGFMIVVAGIMLLTPGFVTDALALLMLLPPVQAAVGLWLLQKLATSSNVHFSFSHTQQQTRENTYQSEGKTFDGEYERKEDHDRLPEDKKN
ncbi:MAG: UPF0716 protein FxsA [Idiomarinaceae bacterium HL-53]|nr:MAG: UPF0716 protein FxsA [Idiomarinaceae bacterium HL-53]CUS48212.1 UPF0716 protein FxsA [Idiomarinaceae bacterium HL-53]